MTQVLTPTVFNSEQEVKDFFAPLQVTEVQITWVHHNGWEVRTNSTHREIGKFLHEHGLLDRCGGSGAGKNKAFYLDHPPWKGQIPLSWLPASARQKDDYHPEVVACKKALTDAGFHGSYLRSGAEEGVRVTDDLVPINLAFVVDADHATLHAKVLTSGRTFKNVYKYVPVTVEQAVKLVQRASGLFVDL